MREYASFVLLGALIVALFLAVQNVPTLAFARVMNGNIGEKFESGTMIFTGDIMLGRGVERLIEREGANYPFTSIENIISHADVAVGNFEASIPTIHAVTPNDSFQLSVREDLVPTLKKAGFDVLGIANNHANDFGAKGLANTRSVITQNSMSVVGDPNVVNDHSSIITNVGSSKVAIFALHNVYNHLDTKAVIAKIAELKKQSDVVLIYIHFGEEYELHHSKHQEKIAHMLIDAGADGIIGHHPHVTEDVEIYEGKPIFYSLGNLIFDQYFSDEVQKGLLVQLKIEKDTINYTLVPISSLKKRTQPSLLPVDEQNETMDDLWARSSSTLAAREGNTLRIMR